ncbi:MAG: cell envelope integrity protein CreD [Nevskiales bacterium]
MIKIEAAGVGGLRHSPLLRVLLLGFLVLLLQIPVSLISGQINARQQTRDAARNEVNSMWGNTQTVIGPVLSIPYVRRWSETKSSGEVTLRQEVRALRLLPEALKINGNLDSESRYRSIFEFSVYRGGFALEGEFATPDWGERGIAAEDVFWDRAELALYVSDPRAIQQPVKLEWNSHPVEFRPGAPRLGQADLPGIRAVLSGRMEGQRFNFKIPLNLKGSNGLRFAPVAKSTQVSLTSDWAHPSFKGSWLPDKPDISTEGFRANWSLGYLGRNYPQLWQHGEDYSKAVCESVFGVDLVTPVDEYRMAERSVKYALLFLSLTFVLIWLYEVLSALRVHPIQYLLVGGSLCLFYLLLLALAEHIGFGAAYLMGAVLVTTQVTAYSLSALRSKARALVLGGVLGSLYGYLYVLLQVQDFALIAGAGGLFLALTAVMYATRRIDWYALRQTPPPPRGADKGAGA